MMYSLYLYRIGDLDGQTERFITGDITGLERARAFAIEILMNGRFGADSKKHEIGVFSDGTVCGYVRKNASGGFSWFNWSGNGSGAHHLNLDGTTNKRKKRKDAKPHPFGL